MRVPSPGLALQTAALHYHQQQRWVLFGNNLTPCCHAARWSAVMSLRVGMRFVALMVCTATLAVVNAESLVTQRRGLTQEAGPDAADVVFQLVRLLCSCTR